MDSVLFSDLLALKLIVLVIAVIISSYLGVAVYKQNILNATNQIFALLSITTSVWLLIVFFSVHPGVNLIFARLSIFLGVLHSFLLFLLLHTIPSQSIRFSTDQKIILYLLTFFVMIFSLTPFTLKSVVKLGDIMQVESGVGSYVFSIFVSYFPVWALISLWKKMKYTKNIIEKKAYLMIFGATLFFEFSMVATITIPALMLQKSFFVQFAPFYTLIFLILTSIAIIKYKLFEIKLLMTKLLMIVIWTFTLFRVLLSATSFDFLYNLTLLTILFIGGGWFIHLIEQDLRAREAFEREMRELDAAAQQSAGTAA